MSGIQLQTYNYRVRLNLAGTATIGKTFTLPPISGKLTGDGLARLTDVIMVRITELLLPEYRGGYAGRETEWR
ncbi:hypothetical protein ACFLUX_03265 [Chloroflexota bacterium]